MSRQWMSTDDREAFFAAVQSNDVTRVKALLDANATLLEVRTSAGESAVLSAAYHRSTEVLALLVARGATVGVYEAAVLGDITLLRSALDAEPTLLSAPGHDGWTLLHLTAFFGRWEAARFLLGRGASVHARSANAMHNQPLHAAAAGTLDLGLVGLLLAAGADVNATQAGGYTPLHSAAQRGSVELARILLEHGARTDVVSDDGVTPLDLAARHPQVAALIRAAPRR